MGRVGGLGKATAILVLCAAATSLIFFFVSELPFLNAASAYANGGSEADYVNYTDSGDIFAGLRVLFRLAAVVVTIIWLYRIAKNNLALGRSGTWGPLWAIFGWIAPPCIFIIPTLTLQEQWKADDPDSTVQAWRQASSSALIWVWGVCFSLALLLQAIAIARISMVRQEVIFTNLDIAEAVASSKELLIAGYVFEAIAGVLFAVVALQLTNRHMSMTGEKSSTPA